VPTMMAEHHGRRRRPKSTNTGKAGTTRKGGTNRRVASTVWVVGVDTHTDTHAAALVDEASAVLAETTVPATPAGYARLEAWARQHIPAGQRMFWAVEGTRSHGHGLTRHLHHAGHRVVEAVKPEPGHRRRRGKSDPLDATHAAQTAQTVERDTSLRHAEPRADGRREALRILLITHRHDTDTRTATINLFKSLLLGAGPLRETLRGLSTTRQVHAVAALSDNPHTDLETRTRVHALRRHAATIIDLNRAVTAAEKQLRTLVNQACPGLLDLPGVGPVTAATLLTVWSHPGRIHSEAALAAIGGISPLPASSGRVIRHRLNRGGDRALNRALHTVVTTRRRMGHTQTSNYITRRTTEGLSDKETLRCLKRYATRQLYRFLQANYVEADPTP
jgi:transposase